MFSFKHDIDFLSEWGFSKIEFNSLCLELKKLLLEQNQSYLKCVKNEGDAPIVANSE